MKRLLILGSILTAVSCCPKQDSFKGKDCNAGIFTKSLNDPKYTLNGDTLSIYSGAKSDYFNAPDGSVSVANAPILMFKADNKKPFTFQAKVHPAFSEMYDAGVLYVYSSDRLWQKLAFEMDERGVSRVVTVRTVETSDDNNHDAVTQPSVYLKISSDTHVIGFYYSLDGVKWQLARLYKNEYPEHVYLGLSSQSPVFEGINTHFTEIRFEEQSVKNFRLGE